MDILLGFLVGLAYPPAIVILIALLARARTGAGILVAIATLGILVGPAVWLMTLIAFGFLAWLAAFAGWVIGLGIAAVIVFATLSSRFRSRSRDSRSAFGS